MSLQNRVTPFGEIAAHSARGLFTGNRGILHDPDTRTLHPTKRWTTNAWIACACDFRGRRRDVMGRNGPGGGAGWTELFFLDEATALAAGHRPCFHCRRDDAKRFQAAWAEGNGVPIQKAPEMDAILHRERLDGRAKRLHPLPSSVNHLPDGAMIASGTGAFLIRGGKPLRWSFEGYQSAPSATDDALLLTPPSTLRALKAGYRPVLHASSRTDAGT